MVYSQALADMRLNQGEIARLQQGVGSGLRIQKPSDDPAGATRALNVIEVLDRVEQYQSNSRLADQQLALESTTLESVQILMQRIKELALGANSGTQTAESQFAYRAELSERLDELIDLANVRDINGDYLFAGFQGDTQPFVVGGAAINYTGDQGVRELQISASRQIASGDSGDRAAFTGNAYSVRFTGPNTFDVVNDTLGSTVLAGQSFSDDARIAFDGIETHIAGQPASGDRFDITPGGTQSLFATVQAFIAEMEQLPGSAAATAQRNQRMNHVIDSLDRGLEHILDTRASVGARRNAIESTESRHEDLRFELQSTLSQTRDLDMTEAISLLQQRITSLEAVQQSFVAISRLSLFNYLR
jgi:flagellar hook-associated protein 3 FlgL